MKALTLIAAAALTLSLAACNNNKPQVVDTTSPDPMASQLANAAPVALPPSMIATVSFRCKDNSLASVDFFKGNTQANLHIGKDPVVVLTAAKDGDPLTGSGYTMTGNQDNITLTKPGGSALSCHH